MKRTILIWSRELPIKTEYTFETIDFLFGKKRRSYITIEPGHICNVDYFRHPEIGQYYIVNMKKQAVLMLPETFSKYFG